MPPENPRIAELRRRVEADPASIAFAQLAEEYRRAGDYQAAEQCCRTGLTRHPGYLSARVTLGRTLIELGKLDEADQELQFVLKFAPDNLTAIRGMAEIHQRRGELEPALDYYRRALPLARQDPEIEETVKQINRDLAAARAPEKSGGLSFAQAQDELLSALSRMPETPAAARPESLPSDAGALPMREAPAHAAEPVAPAAPEPAAPAAPATRTEATRTEPREPRGPGEPGEPGSEPLIDFDGLLESLGTPNHEPPPLVEALLTEPAPPAVRPEPTLPDLPLDALTGDPFADLERGLRAFDQAPPPPPEHRTEPKAPGEPSARGARAGEPDHIEQTILDELEAWLTALQR